jgi:hypothetical protein
MTKIAGARALGVLGTVVMVLALGYGFTSGDLAEEGGALLGTAWGRVTLLEVYVGLAIVSTWIWCRERSAIAATIWCVAVLLVGNLVSCLYIAFAAWSAKGDVTVLLHGKPAVGSAEPLQHSTVAQHDHGLSR